MRTSLVLDALEHAIWTRQQAGVREFDQLVHHADAGSQHTSIALTERLAHSGAAPSVDSVGDAYDNALADRHRPVQDRHASAQYATLPLVTA